MSTCIHTELRTLQMKQKKEKGKDIIWRDEIHQREGLIYAVSNGPVQRILYFIYFLIKFICSHHLSLFSISPPSSSPSRGSERDGCHFCLTINIFSLSPLPPSPSFISSVSLMSFLLLFLLLCSGSAHRKLFMPLHKYSGRESKSWFSNLPLLCDFLVLFEPSSLTRLQSQTHFWAATEKRTRASKLFPTRSLVAL